MAGVVAFAYVRHFEKLFDGPAEGPFATARPAEPDAAARGSVDFEFRDSVRAESEIMVNSEVVDYLVDLAILDTVIERRL